MTRLILNSNIYKIFIKKMILNLFLNLKTKIFKRYIRILYQGERLTIMNMYWII